MIRDEFTRGKQRCHHIHQNNALEHPKGSDLCVVHLADTTGTRGFCLCNFLPRCFGRAAFSKKRNLS